MGNDQIPKKERGYITKQISLTPLIKDWEHGLD